MKKIKKLLIFSLILVCSLYFVLKTGALFTSYANSDDATFISTDEVNLEKPVSEYRDYVSSNKKYHDEKYPDLAGSYYPENVDITLQFKDSTKSYPYDQNEVESIDFTVTIDQPGFYNFYFSLILQI